MKKFKLFTMVGVIAIVAVLMCGCNNEDTNNQGELTTDLESMMTSIYENVDEEKLPMALANTEINDENLTYYTGLTDLDYESGLASESRVGSIAHSIVLLKVNDGTDIEQTKSDIKAQVNPRKWICVGVDDEENVIVDNIGNVIVLIMNNDIAKELHENFIALNK